VNCYTTVIYVGSVKTCIGRDADDCLMCVSRLRCVRLALLLVLNGAAFAWLM
jgi:hypothetical protein